LRVREPVAGDIPLQRDDPLIAEAATCEELRGRELQAETIHGAQPQEKGV